jgi:circadian clock protein KaiB
MTDNPHGDPWALTLYVDGASTSSIRAIETVRRVCDEELGGHVDLHQHPALAARDQIVAAPTLVRRLPGPPRRIVGDLCAAAWRQLGLNLGTAAAGDGHPGPDE